MQDSKDLLAADSYLVETIVYVCPLSCLNAVFSMPEVSPYMAIASIAKLIHDDIEPTVSILYIIIHNYIVWRPQIIYFTLQLPSLEEFVKVLGALKSQVCSVSPDK